MDIEDIAVTQRVTNSEGFAFQLDDLSEEDDYKVNTLSDHEIITDWLRGTLLVGPINHEGKLGLLAPNINTLDEISNKKLFPYEITEQTLRTALKRADIAPYPGR